MIRVLYPCSWIVRCRVFWIRRQTVIHSHEASDAIQLPALGSRATQELLDGWLEAFRTLIWIPPGSRMDVATNV